MRYYSKRFTVCYYPGHWIQYQSCTHSAPSQLPRSILARCYFRGAHMPHHATNNVRILPGTHYTPGWRAAMWIKCLAEGQKCQALTGIEPGNLSLIQSQGFNPIYHGTSTP